MKNITYLLEIETQIGTTRFSSSGNLTHNNKSYVDGLSVQSVSDAELRFSLLNHKKQASALFLNHPIRERAIRLYILTDSIRKLKFQGLGDNISKLTHARADIRAVSVFGQSKFPNAQIAPPIFNHITPVGTIIHAGGQIIEIT